ncbi:hypothetical protein CERZMDRAFT_89976, partial [Cercospora zeae-maydis SCOH1-5]
MLEAYELLYDVIEDDGPFDGILGFSHGGTLASGFIMHHMAMRPSEPLPFRCALFFNALPPFRKVGIAFSSLQLMSDFIQHPGQDPVV